MLFISGDIQGIRDGHFGKPKHAAIRTNRRVPTKAAIGRKQSEKRRDKLEGNRYFKNGDQPNPTATRKQHQITTPQAMSTPMPAKIIRLAGSSPEP